VELSGVFIEGVHGAPIVAEAHGVRGCQGNARVTL
jgi:hypothetical protein